MKDAFFKDKRVVVTGACGTVGSRLIEQLVVEYRVDSLVGLDNDESSLFFLDRKYSGCTNVNFFLADVRDAAKLSTIFDGADVVFHAAAYKHVLLCERSPLEAVRTNILGVQNVVDAASARAVGTVIFMSSDKAVNPTSVMGTSKLMGERLITAANSTKQKSGPVFASTRFGNVLGSRGSVIPLFREQVRKGGPLTLTHEDMTRFIMSLGDVTRLVVDSAKLARGGEVFVTKMPIVRIADLASVMIEELAPEFGYEPHAIEVRIIGAKAGEKMHEELLNGEEKRRTLELSDYFVVLPAFGAVYQDIEYAYPGIINRELDSDYNSSKGEAMSREEIRAFLRKHELLQETTG